MADKMRHAVALTALLVLAACGGGGGNAPDTATDPDDRFGSVDVVPDPEAEAEAQAAAAPTPEILEAPAPPLAICTVPSPLVSVRAERVAARAYTIDHEGQRSWARSIRRDFTDSGWQDFRAEMDKAETLRTLRRGKINLSAKADGLPKLKSSDVSTAACVHHLVVPLILTYQQASNPDVESRQVGSSQQIEVSLIEVARRDGNGRDLLVQRMAPVREGIIVDPFADMTMDPLQ